MFRTFAGDGLAFEYPAGWKLERDDNEGGWDVTVESPAGGFAVVRLARDMPETTDMVMSAFETLKAEYPGLTAKAALETVAGEMAIGHDMEFFSLDLANLAWTRCFFGPAGTVLILCQCSAVDEEEQALRAVVSSMRVEEGEELRTE